MPGFADATKYGIAVDSGIPRGTMYHIACSTWFTATGKAMPQYFKFEDDNGDIQTVRDILVKRIRIIREFRAGSTAARL